MKKLQVLVLIFFIIVAAIFSFTRVKEYITSDFTPPVITAEYDSLRVSVDATEEDLLAGITAYDNLDGDVTDTLVVASKSKFVSTGTLRVNYAAFDRNNNVATYSRSVTFTDYHHPRVRMTQPLRFVNGNSNYDYLRSITVDDCLDGNITQQVKVTFGDTESVSNTASRQKVNLQVTNSAGDSSVLELWASFEDYSEYSQLTPALSDYIIYVQPGERPNYRSLLTGVWSAGNVRSFSDSGFHAEDDVRISDGGVNYSTPGVYSVSYQLSRETADGADRTALGTATLIVVVEDKA